MKIIKFKPNIFITKTNNEAIIILNGDTDVFWGMEGPLAYLVFTLFENNSINIEDEILNMLKEYEVSKSQLIDDIEDCFKTLVENGLAEYE